MRRMTRLREGFSIMAERELTGAPPPPPIADELRMELIYAAHTLASELSRSVRPEDLAMWRAVVLVRADRLVARARALCGEG